MLFFWTLLLRQSTILCFKTWDILHCMEEWSLQELQMFLLLTTYLTVILQIREEWSDLIVEKDSRVLSFTKEMCSKTTLRLQKEGPNTTLNSDQNLSTTRLKTTLPGMEMTSEAFQSKFSLMTQFPIKWL